MALFPFVRPLVFRLEPERAHRATIGMLKALPTRAAPPSPARLRTRVAGIDFPNPVGLAAGFDKNAEVPGAMLGLGFGSVEVGTLTPEPQAGNPRPRLFRLAEDRAVVNRLGFNNEGHEAALSRLKGGVGLGIIGVNVGANKDSADRVADYAAGVRAMAPVADYLTINISSPNTPGLRALQDEGALDALLGAVFAARDEIADGARPPVFLKVAPDLSPAEIDGVVTVAMAHWVDALIVGNTTVSRPPLKSAHAGETGGLSGAPLADLALRALRAFRSASGGAIPLVAAGGIASGADAYARIRAGASLVQLYTALIYEGPGLARRIVRDLDALLARDGFGRVDDAVGKDG